MRGRRIFDRNHNSGWEGKFKVSEFRGSKCRTTLFPSYRDHQVSLAALMHAQPKPCTSAKGLVEGKAELKVRQRKGLGAGTTLLSIRTSEQNEHRD